jgi:hypothetical protein
MSSDPKNVTATSAPADLSKLAPAQIAQLIASAKPIEGPVANAGASLIMQAGNDAIIIFNRPRPLILPDGQFSNIATAEAVAIVHVSMATLKDLWLGIGQNLAIYEASHGEIVTDYMKQQAAAKK